MFSGHSRGFEGEQSSRLHVTSSDTLHDQMNRNTGLSWIDAPKETAEGDGAEKNRM